MSAEVLREAAALMRERAEAARNVTGASDWHVQAAWADEGHGWTCYSVRSSGGRVSSLSAEEEADYIASWHPDVALAVADWLDVASRVAASEDRDKCGPGLVTKSALTVARAYLGAPA